VNERSYRSFADDVSNFAEKLNIPKFSLIGHSGGAMHALATAAFLPTKVVKLAVIGAAAEPKSFKTPRSDFDSFKAYPKHMQDSVNLVGKSPHWLTRFAFWTVSSHLQSPTKFSSEILAHPGEASAFGDDKQSLDEFRTFLEENIAEFFRQGMKPMVDDMRAFCAKPWEFDPEDIKQETSIFVGKIDDYSPVSHSEYLASKIGKSTLHVMENEVRKLFGSTFDHYSYSILTLGALFDLLETRKNHLGICDSKMKMSPLL
jgi:pimeloyl-ACP methyl ester carboxylesterase